MMMIRKTAEAKSYELVRHSLDGDEVVIVAPAFTEEMGDPCLVVAAMVRVAGELLVAEYENQHSVLNDAVRAKNQAEAFATGFRKMTEGTLLPPMHGPASVFDPPLGVVPCAKCGHERPVGQKCLNCELLEEEAKENTPGGQ